MRALTLAAAAALLTLLITPWFGPSEVSLAKVWQGDPLERNILFEFRLSRTLLAMAAGASLALAGSLFQALLRNVLATEYTLGVSSGAAFGAVIAIMLGVPWVWMGAIAGGLATLFLVLGFSLEQTRLSAYALILVGVSVNSVCAALIMLVHSFANFTESFSITMWLIGSVDSIPYPRLLIYAAAVAPLAVWTIWQAPSWNLLALGEQWAAARGANVRTLLIGGCCVGSLLAALTVSVTGPIGFIGLLTPHFVRQFTGADHRILMPCTVLAGATFLGICDAAGRSVFAPAEVPVGVVTALLGGPGLIWIIRSQGRGD